MNPWLMVGGGAAWVFSLVLTGWVSFGLGEDHNVAANAKTEKLIADTREAAQQGAAAAIAQLAPVNKTIVQKVQHEIQTNTVYADCRNTPIGMSSVNSALTGRTIPASGVKLP